MLVPFNSSKLFLYAMSINFQIDNVFWHEFSGMIDNQIKKFNEATRNRGLLLMYWEKYSHVTKHTSEILSVFEPTKGVITSFVFGLHEVPCIILNCDTKPHLWFEYFLSPVLVCLSFSPTHPPIRLPQVCKWAENYFHVCFLEKPISTGFLQDY